MFLLSFLIQEWEMSGDSSYLQKAHEILDWLDNHQNPETGYWDLGRGASLHNAMAGAFHFYFLYSIWIVGLPTRSESSIVLYSCSNPMDSTAFVVVRCLPGP